MELPMAIVVAVLFAGGTYLILKPNLIRMVMGFGLYSNAANLALIMCGGFKKKSLAPFVGMEVNPSDYMDPLPPDIILTAIVISFAVGALLLTLCYRVYLDHGTDNPEMLPLTDDEPSSHTHDDHGHDGHDDHGSERGPDFFHEIADGKGYHGRQPVAHNIATPVRG